MPRTIWFLRGNSCKTIIQIYNFFLICINCLFFTVSVCVCAHVDVCVCVESKCSFKNIEVSIVCIYSPPPLNVAKKVSGRNIQEFLILCNEKIVIFLPIDFFYSYYKDVSVFKFCNRNKHFISLAIWNMKKKIALWHLEKIGRFIFCSLKTFHIHIKQVLHFMVKRKRQQKQGFLAKKTKKLFIRRMLFFFFFLNRWRAEKGVTPNILAKQKLLEIVNVVLYKFEVVGFI